MVAFKYSRDSGEIDYDCFKGGCHITRDYCERWDIFIESNDTNVIITRIATEESFVQAFTALVNWKEGDGLLDLTKYQTGE